MLIEEKEEGKNETRKKGKRKKEENQKPNLERQQQKQKQKNKKVRWWFLEGVNRLFFLGYRPVNPLVCQYLQMVLYNLCLQVYVCVSVGAAQM